MLQMGDEENMTDFSGKLSHLVTQIRNLGEKVEEEIKEEKAHLAKTEEKTESTLLMATIEEVLLQGTMKAQIGEGM
ncbi:unnamed protein product [Spirodela intermedia]|uniref:Uncharacterized protein n=1 Tax=Spirodela intermedia TaxID=51605 RepID=A0A7I8K615_SPIIN|nr:unnamed protein product [Spirodela intermedia]